MSEENYQAMDASETQTRDEPMDMGKEGEMDGLSSAEKEVKETQSGAPKLSEDPLVFHPDVMASKAKIPAEDAPALVANNSGQTGPDKSKTADRWSCRFCGERTHSSFKCGFSFTERMLALITNDICQHCMRQHVTDEPCPEKDVMCTVCAKSHHKLACEQLYFQERVAKEVRKKDSQSGNHRGGSFAKKQQTRGGWQTRGGQQTRGGYRSQSRGGRSQFPRGGGRPHVYAQHGEQPSTSYQGKFEAGPNRGRWNGSTRREEFGAEMANMFREMANRFGRF